MNYNRIRAFGPWLAEAKYVWFAVITTILAGAIALRPDSSEPLIRLTGLTLQILGIGTVVWGIAETRTFFAHKPILEAAKSWFGRSPLRKRQIVFGAAAGAISTATANLRGHVTHGAGANPTIDTRLIALEKNIGALHDRITATEHEFDEQLRKSKDELAAEAAARQSEVEQIRKMLETTATGGVHITAIGATWLFIGVVLSTAAPELANWLKTPNISVHGSSGKLPYRERGTASVASPSR